MKKKAAKFPKRIRVGIFPLGYYMTELFVWPKECGGAFYCNPDDKSVPRIYIGLDQRQWSECLEVLFHETFELACVMHHGRYAMSGKFNGDGADYLFNFDHVTMGRICAYQSVFMADGIPKICTLYKKYRRLKTS